MLGKLGKLGKLEKLGKLGKLGDYGKYHVSSILNLPKLLILPKATPPNFLSEGCRYNARQKKCG